MKSMKCVMVIDQELPAGIAANTAALMGMSLGSRIPEVIGCEACDKSGLTHPGVLQIPLPILKADKETLRAIRTQLYEDAFQDVEVMEFSDVAQQCNVYDEWLDKAKNTEEAEFQYLGVALYGDKKKVNKLTGSLPLYR